MFVGYCNIKPIYTNACGAAIVKPAPTKALPNTLPGTRPDTLPRALRKIGPGHLRLPSPFPAIRPRNAASVMTKMASEAVLGNLKLARRSRVTNGSSPHLVDYRHISTIRVPRLCLSVCLHDTSVHLGLKRSQFDSQEESRSP